MLADAKRVFLELDHLDALAFLFQAVARAQLPDGDSLHARARLPGRAGAGAA